MNPSPRRQARPESLDESRILKPTVPLGEHVRQSTLREVALTGMIGVIGVTIVWLTGLLGPRRETGILVLSGALIAVTSIAIMTAVASAVQYKTVGWCVTRRGEWKSHTLAGLCGGMIGLLPVAFSLAYLDVGWNTDLLVRRLILLLFLLAITLAVVAPLYAAIRPDDMWDRYGPPIAEEKPPT